MGNRFISMGRVQERNCFFSVAFSPFSPRGLMALRPFYEVPVTTEVGGRCRRHLKARQVLPLVFGVTLPTITTRFIGLLCGVMSHVCVNRVPRVKAGTLTKMKIAASVMVLVSSFSTVIKTKNTPLTTVTLKRNSQIHTKGFLNGNFVLLVLFAILASLMSCLFVRPVLLFTKTSTIALPCTRSCLSICLLNALFIRVSAKLGAFVGSRKHPGVTVCSILVKTLLGVILSPVFVF